MRGRIGLEVFATWIAAAGFAVCAAMVVKTATAGIANTKHNLGTSGTQTVHLSAGTDEICVFCHTPHGANTAVSAPLWNKNLPATTYQLYREGGSASLDGENLPVGSVSAACLSCHDGTQAMDNMVNAPGPGVVMPPGWTWLGTPDGKMPAAGITNLGSDLRNDHPVGIAYCGGGIVESGGVSTGTCRDPDFNPPTSATINGFVQWWVNTTGFAGVGGTAAREKTDMILFRRVFAANGNTPAGTGPSVECASCHDPHVEPTADAGGVSGRKTFLRISNAGSAVCLSCHNK